MGAWRMWYSKTVYPFAIFGKQASKNIHRPLVLSIPFRVCPKKS